MLIHGIFPGPRLFIDYPEVTWTFIDSMLVGQILMGIFGVLLSGLAAKVLKIPRTYLAPIIMVLALFGTFSVHNSYADVMIMLGLGILMFVLEGFGLRSAPLVLGLVLGPIAESNFIQGSIIAGAEDGMLTYFLAGGMNLFLISLCLLSIIYSLWNHTKSKKLKS